MDLAARRARIWIGVAISFSGGVLVAGTTPTVPAEVQAVEQQRIEAMERASRPTVAVFAPEKSAGGGSGVLISPDGFALTNFHVVQPCGNHMKCGLNDGRLYDAVVVGIDPTGDLALIKLLGRQDFPAAEMGDSDRLQIGEPCFAIGNPFLLATDLRPTVTYGVISGIRRYQPPAAGAILEYTDCIQTDAAINPGNSGGPLFNAAGQLIGINGRGSFEKRGRVNVGVGYAISLTQVKNFLGVLHSGRIVDHATLGATASTDEGSRVVVTNLLESADAYRRGLRYGDQIVELAGRPIDSANTLKNVLGILPRDWRVPLVFRRDDEVLKTWVRLAGVHSPEVLLELAQQGLGEEEPQRPEPPSEEEPPPGDGQTPPKPEPNRRRIPGLPPHHPGLKPAEPLPSAVAEVFEARRGFANYYFNRSNRQRVWERYRQQTDLSAATGTWRLTGSLSTGGSVLMSLSDEQVSARLASPAVNQELAFELSQDLSQLHQPEGSGGWYLLLSLWRRFHVLGPERFGDVYYWGTAPLPELAGDYDVFVATHDVIESRLYFRPGDGQLVAMEMFPDGDVDPCEVYFSDYREINGQAFPHRMLIKYGDLRFGEVEWTEISLPPLATPEEVR